MDGPCKELNNQIAKDDGGYLKFMTWFKVAVSAAETTGTEIDRFRAICAKRYIEISKNSKKITINIKKL